MEISPRKPSKRTPEPVDEWLHNEGYFRKHAPKDPTCLFRAVSEQVYLTQHFHIRVRLECVKFMKENRHLFEESVTIPYESYLEQMSCFTEWGGILEIRAMSLLYEREVIVFSGQKLMRHAVTDNGFEKMIFLCHTIQKQYETIYAKDFIATAAYCQSLVYQTLYKDVFKMANVDSTVHRMLHDRTDNFRHDKFFLKENLEIREQLTTELYTKMDSGSDEGEDTRPIARGITPFPYRIAKALDPNIYRNTDFDIWQEIRREVRNAGWTRYNGMELQVGGKCLVQMDIKEDELDKTNNNSVYIGSDKDNNGNEQKVTTKIEKREPLSFSGHIQEMSKNEGPVVVFIEELGEKRTVPYSALKPLSSWKNKQSNWGHSTYKKNVPLDSNQKGKKSWVTNSRKMKDIMTNADVLVNNNVNRNSNHNAGNNKGKSDEITQWDNDAGHGEENHSAMSFETYAMDSFTSYQDYAIDASTDVMPVTMVLENSQPRIIESVQQEITEGVERNTSPPSKNNEDNESSEKMILTNPASAVASRNNAQYCNHRSQNETFYPLQSGIPQYFAGNPNIYFSSLEGNPYSVPPYFVGNSGEPSIPNNLIDRTLRSINLSVSKSVDVNGSDLPFSDTMTLRFFYNLGLEYFRASHTWMCGVTGQSTTFNPYYVTQTNPSSLNSIVGPSSGAVPNEEGGSRGTDDARLNCTISQRKDQSVDGNGKGNGGQHTLRSCAGSQDLQTPNKDAQKQLLDNSPKNSSHLASEKMKDQATPNRDTQRTGRNSLGPRFKKNTEGRYRNSCQQIQQQQQQQQRQQQQQQQQQQHAVQYQHNAVNVNSSSLHCAKSDGGQGQRPSAPHQQVNNIPAGSPSTYRVPYAQQTAYPTLPYYMGETEALPSSFYTSNPGFIPLPCVPHSDMADGANMNHFLPHIYPGMENYAQSYSTVYPQYLYPQQNMYPGVPPQSAQENWYTLPGQTHYIQYTPIPSSLPGTPSNVPPQNISTV